MALINVPGTKAHRDEVEAHMIAEMSDALDTLVERYNDATLRELAWAFARCAGAVLGEIVRQWEGERDEHGRPPPAKTVPLLAALVRQLEEVRVVGLDNWTGKGR